MAVNITIIIFHNAAVPERITIARRRRILRRSGAFGIPWLNTGPGLQYSLGLSGSGPLSGNNSFLNKRQTVNGNLKFLKSALGAGYFGHSPELEFRGYFLVQFGF